MGQEKEQEQQKKVQVYLTSMMKGEEGQLDL